MTTGAACFSQAPDSFFPILIFNNSECSRARSAGCQIPQPFCREFDWEGYGKWSGLGWEMAPISLCKGSCLSRAFFSHAKHVIRGDSWRSGCDLQVSHTHPSFFFFLTLFTLDFQLLPEYLPGLVHSGAWTHNPLLPALLLRSEHCPPVYPLLIVKPVEGCQKHNSSLRSMCNGK